MTTIQLNCSNWDVDFNRELGPPGGFARVYLGYNQEQNETFAIKQFSFDARSDAHRELSIARDLVDHKFSHIIRFHDYGYDEGTDAYYVVMARADSSLADYIRSRSDVDVSESLSIVRQILVGLIEAKKYVHRDLKPGNILLHDGNWKIADFGIARLIEKATSLKTLKEAKTPHYAAPEQWRGERATNATDVYALGCIAYELLSGKLPFNGPTYEDFSEQHQNNEPPHIDGISESIQTMIQQMLYKSADARISHERIHAVLQGQLAKSEESSSALAALVKVGNQIATKETKEHIEAQKAQSDASIRLETATEAHKNLASIINKLFETINRHAPSANERDTDHPSPGLCYLDSNNVWVKLGDATLRMHPMGGIDMIDRDAFDRSDWDVIAGAFIVVHQPQPQYEMSASLWFTNLGREGEYRWYEVSYFYALSARKEPVYEPFGLTDLKHAALAASQVISGISMAHDPYPIDGEDAESFFERWILRFAQAAERKLEKPSYLPM